MLESDRIVISNTTPIISLSLIDKLDLLRLLYGEVWIPPAVRAELLAGGTQPGATEIHNADFIRPVALADPRKADLLNDLDRGEAEVIALALEHRDPLVLIDERLGRRHAQRLGLAVTGVVGVLLQAKATGHLPTVGPLLEQMIRGGIRLGDELVDKALQMAKEK